MTVDIERIKFKVLDEIDAQFFEMKTICKTIDYLHSRGYLGGVADGYVVVPKEPTEEMIEAAHLAGREIPWGMQVYAHEYKSMIEAAPKGETK